MTICEHDDGIFGIQNNIRGYPYLLKSYLRPQCGHKSNEAMRGKNKIVNPYLFKLLRELITFQVRGATYPPLKGRELRALVTSKKIRIGEEYIVKVFRETKSGICNFDEDTLDELIAFIGAEYGYRNWEDFEIKEGDCDISIRAEEQKDCFFYLSDSLKEAITQKVQQRIVVLTKSGTPSEQVVLFENMNTFNEWTTFSLIGSDIHSYHGGMGTEMHPAKHPLTSFSGKTTVIAGVHSSEMANWTQNSKVLWLLPTIPEAMQHFEKAYLFFCCKRRFGGLHSKQYNGGVTVRINGKPIDGFWLRVIPEGHGDYFHRPPVPQDFPDIKPFSDCQTIYTWNLYYTLTE